MKAKAQKLKFKSDKKQPVPAHAKRHDTGPETTLLFAIIIAIAYVVAALFALQLNYKKPQAPAVMEAPASVSGTENIRAAICRNPELENMKNLRAGGSVEKKLPVVDRLKFTLSDTPFFDGADPVYALSVCCRDGTQRDYYTCKMPWAFIMYEFEQGVPTVTIFEIKSEKKEGRYEIVVMDPQADPAKIKAVSVSIYEELLRQYMPGIEWKGSVRQEIK
ncbi:MAG: hypothetical protein LLG37_08855 [Spirochaetia bacterium]|nr:hypothetical protein [Spirochaetia bacterium]